jgi:hypothetical protein
MSETITEMILPGTYIDVRAEGLIGVGGISTGNVGIVGTAKRGPLDEVRILSSYSEALDTYGLYDAFPTLAADIPKALTLTRALEQAFRGGASTVFAVRVGDFGAGGAQTRSWTVDDAAAALFTLTATSPGTWANDIVAGFDAASVTLSLTLGRQKEEFTGTDAAALAQAIKDGSQLVLVSAGPSAADAGKKPTKVTPGAAVTTNGTPISTTQLASGLGLLAGQDVNIIIVGGFDARTAAATVVAHLEATENDARERIAVIGASTDDAAKIKSDDVAAVSNARVVLVAPGIVAEDAARTTVDKRVKLPAPYAAALVAGRLSTLGVHISLTNKDVAAIDVSTQYSRGIQKDLLNNRVLLVKKELGIRVVKGITTDTGPFRQISVRRTVDYAKAGVRIGSNPYIGRLNNSRVRAALKATLDGFLSQMVLDEMLTGYTLDVAANRAQEIAGQAIVTMTLQPTFSIDFIKVIMNLQ